MSLDQKDKKDNILNFRRYYLSQMLTNKTSEKL